MPLGMKTSEITAFRLLLVTLWRSGQGADLDIPYLLRCQTKLWVVNVIYV